MCGTSCALSQSTSWTHLSQSAAHISSAQIAPVSLDNHSWSSMTDHNGHAVTFSWWQTPIVHNNRVYAIGESDSTWGIIAYEIDTGNAIWKAPVPSAPLLDSWSSLAIDTNNNTIVACVNTAVTAVNLTDGSPAWSAALFEPVVNASPVISDDLGDADRLFITDYSGFGPGSSLYCINIDPFNAAANAYQPGDIVWSVPIGQASGSTPAYIDGIVYVATADGWIRAFDATSIAPPSPLWETQSVAGQGFFGGVAVTGNAGSRSVFAATYNANGSIDSSRLVKLDAETGAVVWTVPSNRTDTIPVPLPNGQVVVSGGLRGFGTVPSIALYDDLGTSAVRVWDSALDSWIDLNSNNLLDPGEYLDIGGWSSQPVVLMNSQGERASMYTGTLSSGAASFGIYESLVEVDMTKTPSSAEFVTSSSMHAGASAAIIKNANGDTHVISIGSSGLSTFASSCYADCDGSGSLNIFDYICFGNLYAINDPSADCDGSGTLNIFDYICFGNLYAIGCD
ncbi:MAG: PQQ-binding-like beta-propeller repeat protein [Phycisphaeraceae bacterium]|nr:PQQ-binding-like beta-propeller repeat protein [Phycisphaerales bacterium]MCB9861240.1 PQQ-binding-like beta-propeller repeat protein [Phycisphaeraceae bacterium]